MSFGSMPRGHVKDDVCFIIATDQMAEEDGTGAFCARQSEASGSLLRPLR